MYILNFQTNKDSSVNYSECTLRVLIVRVTWQSIQIIVINFN